MSSDTMINARAARRMRLNGKSYAKGDPVELSAGQYDDLAAVGLVERVTVPPRALMTRVAQAAQPRSTAAKQRAPRIRKPARKKAG